MLYFPFWVFFFIEEAIGVFFTSCFFIVLISRHGWLFSWTDLKSMFSNSSENKIQSQNKQTIRRGNTSRWEWIAKRMAILASYGIDMSHFDKSLDDPDFLTDEWLEKYWGTAPPEYIQKELDSITI